jgi:hypothetical protein
MPNAATAAREIPRDILNALDTAAQVHRRLVELGITGATLIGHDNDIPLVRIDPPPREAGIEAKPYWKIETALSVRICCFGYFGGAVLIWFEEHVKAKSRRLH